MMHFRSFVSTYLPCIVAGFFIGTSYIPFPAWASIFCFVPLWRFWWHTDNLKKILLGGWITQFVLTLIGFNWITYTVHEFGMLPWPLAVLVLFLFCGVANLDVPLTGLVWWFLKKRYPLKPQYEILRLAVLAALFETYVPTLFPWNYGYTLLWTGIPMAQMGEIVGFQGLSSVVILLNIGFFKSFELWKKEGLSFTQKSQPAMISLILVVLFSGVGWGLKNRLEVPDRKLKVVLTQANVGNQMKVRSESGPEFREVIVDRYVRLTQQAVEQAGSPDVIVWPETAIPYDFDFERGFSYPIRKMITHSKDWGGHLITGGYSYLPGIEEVTNSMVVIQPDEMIQPDPYYKTHLLAFGEYIPFGDKYPWLYKLIPAGRFARGGGPAVKELKLKDGSVKIGPQICYESLFPQFANALAQKGAQILVNITNDSWYGTWQEPFQHLYMTVARSIETRRPLIRATNTGISTVALASGEVLETSPMAQEWSASYQLPFRDQPQVTFYAKYPWLIELLLISLFAILMIASRFTKP